MGLGGIGRRAVGYQALQGGFICRCDPAGAQRAEQGEKARIFLTEDMLQRQQGKLGLAKGVAIEKVLPAMALLQDRGFLAGYDRR